MEEPKILLQRDKPEPLTKTIRKNSDVKVSVQNSLRLFPGGTELLYLLITLVLPFVQRITQVFNWRKRMARMLKSMPVILLEQWTHIPKHFIVLYTQLAFSSRTPPFPPACRTDSGCRLQLQGWTAGPTDCEPFLGIAASRAVLLRPSAGKRAKSVPLQRKIPIAVCCLSNIWRYRYTHMSISGVESHSTEKGGLNLKSIS